MNSVKVIIHKNKIHAPCKYILLYVYKYNSESKVMKTKYLKIEPLMDLASNYNWLKSAKGTSLNTY